MFWVDVCLVSGRKLISVKASARDKINADMFQRISLSPSAS